MEDIFDIILDLSKDIENTDKEIKRLKYTQNILLSVNILFIYYLWIYKK